MSSSAKNRSVASWARPRLVTLVAAFLLAIGAGSVTATADEPLPPPVLSSLETATQSASLVYGDPSGSDAYATPGGLVVAGRDNFDAPVFRRVDARGGSVLLYLDAIIDNDHGRYHRLLLESSSCGPAVGRWPGSPRANRWGFLNDFRPGSVLQDKLRCVLETMVAENPQMSGWLADDLGSRSWFPGFSWEDWDPADQRAYRAGAVELVKTFRQVADEHGLLVIVNGTWTAGNLASSGGGYPDPGRSGNALADGGLVEHHDDGTSFFVRYACSSQWASASPVTRGRAVNFAVTRTWEALQTYASSGCFAYASKQDDYDVVRPWGRAHDLGLQTSRKGS